MQNKKRKISPSIKYRQRAAQQVGQQLKRAGVKVGRKLIDTSKIPNVDNYAGVMRGMGYSLKRTDLLKARNRRRSF